MMATASSERLTPEFMDALSASLAARRAVERAVGTKEVGDDDHGASVDDPNVKIYPGEAALESAAQAQQIAQYNHVLTSTSKGIINPVCSTPGCGRVTRWVMTDRTAWCLTLKDGTQRRFPGLRLDHVPTPPCAAMVAVPPSASTIPDENKNTASTRVELEPARVCSCILLHYYVQGHDLASTELTDPDVIDAINTRAPGGAVVDAMRAALDAKQRGYTGPLPTFAAVKYRRQLKDALEATREEAEAAHENERCRRLLARFDDEFGCQATV